MTAKSITIGKFPIPPTSNLQYAPLVIKGRVRLVPSGRLRAFKKAMANWGLVPKNDFRIKQARLFCLECFSKKNYVRADSYFCFPKEDIFYKNGSVVRMDATNRIKALHDEFFTMMGIDDSRIFSGYIEKLGTTSDSAFAFIVLSEHRFRMVSDVRFGDIPA